MRRPAVQTAQHVPRGDHKLQILHVGIALGNGGMVVEHQQHASGDLNSETTQGQSAQIPGHPETELRFNHPGRHLALKVFAPADNRVQRDCGSQLLWSEISNGLATRFHLNIF